MGGVRAAARTAAAPRSASTVAFVGHARNAAEPISAFTSDSAANARSVAVVLFAVMAVRKVLAKTVGADPSANTDAGAVDAKTATQSLDWRAKDHKETTSASMATSARDARPVEALSSVSMVDDDTAANSAKP